jgi:hypothetical protein
MYRPFDGTSRHQILVYRLRCAASIGPKQLNFAWCLGSKRLPTYSALPTTSALRESNFRSASLFWHLIPPLLSHTQIRFPCYRVMYVHGLPWCLLPAGCNVPWPVAAAICGVLVHTHNTHTYIIYIYAMYLYVPYLFYCMYASCNNIFYIHCITVYGYR